MPINEPQCVQLKRAGAKYVSGLISGKTEQEQLEFWKKRTEALKSPNNSMQSDKPVLSDFSATLQNH